MRYFVTDAEGSRLTDEFPTSLLKTNNGKGVSILLVRNALPQGQQLIDLGNGAWVPVGRVN